MSENELTVVEQNTAPQSVSLIKKETDVKQENMQSLLVLNQILDNKQDAVNINGKRHLEYEDWIALGNTFGLAVATGDAEPVEVFGVKGFKAKARVIQVETGNVIGGAEAYCLENEYNWEGKDYFQMASMAQTRAGSKALSNELRGVVALKKTLDGTPAEEMNNNEVASTKPNKKSKKKPKAKKSKPKKETKKEYESIDDVAIEVEATEVHDMTPEAQLKNSTNETIQKAITELEATDTEINSENTKSKLLDLLETGSITEEEYNTAKTEL